MKILDRNLSNEINKQLLEIYMQYDPIDFLNALTGFMIRQIILIDMPKEKFIEIMSEAFDKYKAEDEKKKSCQT